MAVKRRTVIYLTLGLAVVVALILWKPTVLIYGLQTAGMYAAIAIPILPARLFQPIVTPTLGEFFKSIGMPTG